MDLESLTSQDNYDASAYIVANIIKNITKQISMKRSAKTLLLGSDNVLP